MCIDNGACMSLGWRLLRVNVFVCYLHSSISIVCFVVAMLDVSRRRVRSAQSSQVSPLSLWVKSFVLNLFFFFLLLSQSILLCSANDGQQFDSEHYSSEINVASRSIRVRFVFLQFLQRMLTLFLIVRRCPKCHRVCLVEHLIGKFVSFFFCLLHAELFCLVR